MPARGRGSGGWDVLSGTRRTREPRGPEPWGDRTTSRPHSPGRRARAPSGRAGRSTVPGQGRHRRPRGRHAGRGSTPRSIPGTARVPRVRLGSRGVRLAAGPRGDRPIESGQRRDRSSLLDQQAAAQGLQPRVAGSESEARLDVGHGARGIGRAAADPGAEQPHLGREGSSATARSASASASA